MRGPIHSCVPQPVRPLRLATAAAPVSPASVELTSTLDDPLVAPATRVRLPREAFTHDEAGRPVGLKGPHAEIFHEPVLPRLPSAPSSFTGANNPFSPLAPTPQDDFVLDGDHRFPALHAERGPDGLPILDGEGRQRWRAVDTHLGQTTAFVAAHQVHAASERFAGRPVRWGNDGVLAINPHGFHGPAAFGRSRALSFGVVSHTPRGEQQPRLVELASSWEIVAHEAGHAVWETLKPHGSLIWAGQYSESFADLTALWTALTDPTRAQELVRQTGGDLSRSSSVTRMGELFGRLGRDTVGFDLPRGDGPLRDAANSLTLSAAKAGRFNPIEVLTGAAYAVFVKVYESLVAEGRSRPEAVLLAAQTLGTFNARTTAHTREERASLQDVAAAYLTVDREYFGSRYRDLLVRELSARELLTPQAIEAWTAKRLSLPALRLPASGSATERAARFFADHGDAFTPSLSGARVTSVEQDDRGNLLVRAATVRSSPTPREERSLVVFRPDGSLMDVV